MVKGWSLWGEYLQSLFEVDSSLTLGLSVLTCYLHACRTMKEAKCRKYLAYIIWLLTHDDANGSMAEVRGRGLVEGEGGATEGHLSGCFSHFCLMWLSEGNDTIRTFALVLIG